MRTATVVAVIAALPLLSSCLTPARSSLEGLPAAAYRLDPAHTSVTWKVSHRGLSAYTARFVRVSASLDFDPQAPEEARLSVSIDPSSVRTDHPDGGGWDRTLARDWFRADTFPEIRFESTRVIRTGETTGQVEGEISFLGRKRPLLLDVAFNGAAPSGGPGSPPALGFSASASLLRSDFGMTRLPSLVGDRVDIIIETEFLATTRSNEALSDGAARAAPPSVG
jgi:polyisoprenoid-binding protein YceI